MNVVVHAFLDGRDTPPQSAEASLVALEEKCRALGNARIASVCGRYFAMDRDQRWDRVQTAYDLIVDGKAPLGTAGGDSYDFRPFATVGFAVTSMSLPLMYLVRRLEERAKQGRK